jgi:hypothetical protein
MSGNFGTNVADGVVGHTVGDLDCNLRVEFADFLILSGNFGEQVDVPEPTTCNPNTGGDIDGNGVVDFGDFLTMSANFGTTVAAGISGHTVGDLDCNGSVEFADFLTMSGNFGQSVGGAQAQSVPEPSGLALLSLAGVACGLLRRRRI